MRAAALVLASALVSGCGSRAPQVAAPSEGRKSLELLAYVPKVSSGGQGIVRVLATDIDRLVAARAVQAALDADGGWLRRDLLAVGQTVSLDPTRDLRDVVAVWYEPSPGHSPWVLAARVPDPGALADRALHAGGHVVGTAVVGRSGQELLMAFRSAGVIVVGSTDMLDPLIALFHQRAAGVGHLPELDQLLGSLSSSESAIYYERFPHGFRPPQELAALAGAHSVIVGAALDRALEMDGVLDFPKPARGARSAPAAGAAVGLRQSLAALIDNPLVALAGAARYLTAVDVQGSGTRLVIRYQLPDQDVAVLTSQLLAGAKLFRNRPPVLDDLAAGEAAHAAPSQADDHTDHEAESHHE